MKEARVIESNETESSNRSLLLFYMIPYALYVTIPMTMESQESIYMVRLLLVPLAILLLWKKYLSLKGPKAVIPSIATGAITGLVGCALWIILSTPFAPPDEIPPWSLKAFTLRLIAATLLVPIFEELFVRGYLFRLILQWEEAKKKGSHSPLSEALYDCNISTVKPGAWSVAAILISTLLFASGHRLFEWPAAFIYGILLSTLWIVRKDMISLISAHATTNFCLAIYVYQSGYWMLW